MKRIIIFYIIFVIASCSSCSKTIKAPKHKISTGWLNPHTYIVKVSGVNLSNAINKAKRKILRDIVYVRMRSNSMYTDIVKIKKEFKTPLERGRVINKRKLPEGVEIHFKIRGKGLREKFERK
ncbi:hypothetical protein ACFL20_08335 [Spirochaetota bacterium]